MRLLRLSIVTLLLVMQLACENWMELIPPEGLIRDEYWKTKEEVASVLMGAYETFSKMDGNLFKYGEMRGDMVARDNNITGDDQKIMEGNIYPENYMCNWENFYKVINYCNEIIKNAAAVQELDNTFTDYQLQGYISEAKFLRGLSYFYLVRIFRDVPFPLEPSETDDSDFYLPLTDGDEILEYLVEELMDARQYATTDGYQTLNEIKGRATKAAFDALLADMYLWMFNYEACISYCNNILFSIDYDLMPSARWFEIFYPGNSIESIFEFQFNTAEDQNNGTYGLTSRYSYNFDPSEKAIEMFAKEFTRELYRGEDASIAKYGEDDFIIWKYVGRAPDGQSTRAGFEQYSCNWIVYRLADVVLMKAEALSQQERYAEALGLINMIRERADVSPITIADSKVAYEDAILHERALELAFEGKRWFDLLRMGRRNDFARKSKLIEAIVDNVPATQKRILAVKLTNPSGWYLPVYEKELERNKNLVQNSYYKY